MTQPKIIQLSQSPARPHLAVQVAAFLAVYLALGWVSFRYLAPAPLFFAAWLPGGLLAAALLLSPPRRWGWFGLSALAANLLLGWLSGLEPRLNLAFAAGSAIEILIAASVAVRLKRPFRLIQDRWEIISLTMLGLAAGGLLNVGLAGLASLGSPFAAQLRSGWSVWWLGHLLGAAVTTFFCLTWITPPALKPLNRRQAAGLSLEILLLLAAAGWFLVYQGARVIEMAIISVLIILWLAMRHNPHGLAAGVLAITVHGALGLAQAHAGLSPAALVIEMMPVQTHFVLVILIGLGSTIYLELLKRTAQANASAETQDRLAEMELLYRSVFEQSSDGMVITDPATQLPLYFNDQACLMLGYTREEYACLGIADIDAQDNCQDILQRIKNITAQGGETFETLHRAASGQMRSILVSVKPISLARQTALLCTLRDITERKQAEERLRFQAHLLDVVGQAITTTDLGGRITYWNRAAEELFGWKAAEALGQDLVDLTIHPSHPDEKLQMLQWLSSGGRWSGETPMRRRDGSTFLGQADDMPIVDHQDQLVGIISITQDISAHRAAEDELRKSNFMRDILSASLMSTPLALVFWKVEKGQSEILDWNPAAEAILGWMREEVIGKSFAVFQSGPAAESRPAGSFDKLSSSEPLPNRMQCKAVTRSGQALLMDWFNTSLTDLASHENAVYVLSLGENVTERQRAEEQLRASLQEKEILLREVYHRVKNNLMIMISLIDLQSANISDPKTLAILKDLQARVRTMALVHQSLYQSTSLSQVDFEGYLIALISYLSSLYRTTRKVEISFAVENLSLRIETAIPCGLMINELVSNAYKYAFPEGHGFGEDGKECCVHIGFTKIGDQYLLEVKDNGIGLPDGFDVANSPSLGIQMVSILTTQIDGTLEIMPAPGTHFKITFAERASSPAMGVSA